MNQFWFNTNSISHSLVYIILYSAVEWAMLCSLDLLIWSQQLVCEHDEVPLCIHSNWFVLFWWWFTCFHPSLPFNKSMARSTQSISTTTTTPRPTEHWANSHFSSKNTIFCWAPPIVCQQHRIYFLGLFILFSEIFMVSSQERTILRTSSPKLVQPTRLSQLSLQLWWVSKLLLQISLRRLLWWLLLQSNVR